MSDPFDVAIARLNEIGERIRIETSDGKPIVTGMQAIREGAMQMVDVMRTLVEEMKNNAAP